VSEKKKGDSGAPPADLLDEDDPSVVFWETLPWEARCYVYEHLRKEAAAARYRAAEARLHSLVSTSGLAREASDVEKTHFAVETAFEAALLELESADPFTCEECGNLHPPAAPHPKDLS